MMPIRLDWRDGGTLARRWRENGHSVRVANSRGPEAVKPFADESADAAGIYAAVDGADVVLLSIPLAWVSTKSGEVH